VSALTNSAIAQVPDAIVDLLRAAPLDTPIWCVAHVDPDADAVGSAYGFAHAARDAGFTNTFVVWDGAPSLPKTCRLIPGAGLAVPVSVADAVAQLDSRDGIVVTFDTPTRARLGAAAGLVDRAAQSIKIDHHKTNDDFATTTWVDASRAATAVMVYRLIDELGWSIGQPTATALYAGLALDTRNFSTRMDRDAFEVAEALRPLVSDPAQLVASVFPAPTSNYWRVFGQVTDSAGLFSNGDLVKALLPLDRMTAAGLDWQDGDPLADDLRAWAYEESTDARVVVLIRERVPGREYKIHFRSVRPSDPLDMSSLASLFGGGGHLHEAAATVVAADGETLNLVGLNRLVASTYQSWTAQLAIARGIGSIESRQVELVLPSPALENAS